MNHSTSIMYTDNCILAVLLFLLLRVCKPDDNSLYNCLALTDSFGGLEHMSSRLRKNNGNFLTIFNVEISNNMAGNVKLVYQAVSLRQEDCKNNRTMDRLETPEIQTNYSLVSLADLKVNVFIGAITATYIWAPEEKNWIRIIHSMLTMVPDPSRHRLFCADLKSVWSIDVKTFHCGKICRWTKGPIVGLDLDAGLEQLFLFTCNGALYKLGVVEDSKHHLVPTKGKLRSFVIDPHKRYIYATMQGNTHAIFVLTYKGKVISTNWIQQDMISIVSIDLYEKKIIYKTTQGIFEFNPRENQSSKYVFPSHDKLMQIQCEEKIIATLQHNGKISVYDRSWRKIEDIYNPHAFRKAAEFVLISK